MSYQQVKMKIRIYVIINLVLLSNILLGQNDWQSILQDNAIICIGEEAHGVKSYYEEKMRIIHEIDSLSDKPIFILIESPLIGSILSKLKYIPSNYHYPHTNTGENISFFANFKNLGFDIQEDCRYKEFSKYLVYKHYVKELDPNLHAMDSLLSLCIIGSGNYSKEKLTEKETKHLKLVINNLKNEVIPKIQDEDEKILIELCFKNRIFLAEYLNLSTKKRYKERIKYRDKYMAENILFITQKYKKHTFIIWSTNLHLGRKGIMRNWSKDNIKSCAEYLEKEVNIYNIAITSKKHKLYEKCFDKIILVKRKFIDKKYFKSNCN